MKSLLSKSIALFVLTSAFACASPLEGWTGDIDCNGQTVDMELYLDRSADKEPQGFIGFENNNTFVFLAIEDLEFDGNEITFEFEDGDAELERDGDELEGDVEIDNTRCEADLKLEN